MSGRCRSDPSGCSIAQPDLRRETLHSGPVLALVCSSKSTAVASGKKTVHYLWNIWAWLPFNAPSLIYPLEAPFEHFQPITPVLTSEPDYLVLLASEPDHHISTCILQCLPISATSPIPAFDQWTECRTHLNLHICSNRHQWRYCPFCTYVKELVLSILLFAQSPLALRQLLLSKCLSRTHLKELSLSILLILNHRVQSQQLLLSDCLSWAHLRKLLLVPVLARCSSSRHSLGLGPAA